VHEVERQRLLDQRMSRQKRRLHRVVDEVPRAHRKGSASGIPYTIVRSTQFFEFLGHIAQSGTIGQTVRLSTTYVQPITSDDVADAMTDAALGAPVNGTIEIAGPGACASANSSGAFCARPGIRAR
jgi:hypothetical protein